MINWIQNFFHTDKWWGKTIFIILIYPIYWCVFYGLFLIIPREWFLVRENSTSNFLGYSLAFLLFVLVPILSFYIPYVIKKTFKINKVFLYILHVVLVIISILLFMGIGLVMALNNFQIG